MNQIATKQEQDEDDRDPSQELSDNERAEYEAWSKWLEEKMKEETNGRS